MSHFNEVAYWRATSLFGVYQNLPTEAGVGRPNRASHLTLPSRQSAKENFGIECVCLLPIKISSKFLCVRMFFCHSPNSQLVIYADQGKQYPVGTN